MMKDSRPFPPHNARAQTGEKLSQVLNTAALPRLVRKLPSSRERVLLDVSLVRLTRRPHGESIEDTRR